MTAVAPRAVLVSLFLGGLPGLAAEHLSVDGNARKNTVTAIFDAPLGERITAVSSAVACDATWEPQSGLVSGSCSLPLTSLKVDGDDTKTGHFRQWATNKKSDPARCVLAARFDAVQLPTGLQPDVPQPFTAELSFRVCGRAREDGGTERVNGTLVLLGTDRRLRIRARIEHFQREAYRIGPRFTDGWLARVQTLAKVVAEEGELELTLFAAPAAKADAGL
ncbi:MAG: hypothetical protein ACLQDQ_00340 [Myxococcaceae bacterium]